MLRIQSGMHEDGNHQL